MMVSYIKFKIGNVVSKWSHPLVYNRTSSLRFFQLETKNNPLRRQGQEKELSDHQTAAHGRAVHNFLFSCGGKSEGINCIYHSFKRIAAPVFIVPEAATIIGTAGLTLDLSQFEPRQIELFQIYLMRLQYNLEEIVLNIATQL